MPSPFKFQKYGESGLEVSEIFQHTARHMDDIAVIRSMHADVPNHEPSLLLMNCGDARLVRPSMGSWVTYGLGTENQNLPGFITMCPGGYPIAGHAELAGRRSCPASFRARYVNTQHTDIEKLIENVRNNYAAARGPAAPARPARRAQLPPSRRARRRRRSSKPASSRSSWPIACRCEASRRLRRQPRAAARPRRLRRGTQARQMLIARRLIERGVRFVQV